MEPGEFCVKSLRQERKKTPADTNTGRDTISNTETAWTVCPLQTEELQAGRKDCVGTSGVDTCRELCLGELFTFPAVSPWLGRGQWAGATRNGNLVLSPHSCEQPLQWCVSLYRVYMTRHWPGGCRGLCEEKLGWSMLDTADSNGHTSGHSWASQPSWGLQGENRFLKGSKAAQAEEEEAKEAAAAEQKRTQRSLWVHQPFFRSRVSVSISSFSLFFFFFW